jgi:radical SAM protein with 4Fe4S-binding SPASM domain
VSGLNAVQWSLFFLVPTGRALSRDMISPEQHERVFNWLYELSGKAPFDIKSTAAPAYRRVVIQKAAASGVGGGTLAGAGYRYEDGLNRPVQGVNDGKGFCFVSHVGDVCPSGFLPLPAGNVRERSVVDIYRNSRLFRELREPALLTGKCGGCRFREVCGGSRARAYAVTGDYLGSDPSCVFEPQNEETAQAAGAN